MNILLTGGAGFIGSHTADALIARGHSVKVLDCLDAQVHGGSDAFPLYMNPGAHCIRGDVRKLDDVVAALHGIDVVYHFAAQTGVGQSMYEVRSYVDTNCTGTATLLEAIMKGSKRIKRLVLASSRAVYGEGSYHCAHHGAVSPLPRSRSQLEAGEYLPICPVCAGPVNAIASGEESRQLPVSIYGWTKLQQEQLCLQISDTIGIEVVALRYFNVIGSRQALGNPYTGILTAFYNAIAADRPIQLYELGKPLRDFVHVSDIVAANVLALDAALPRAALAINVGSGKSSSIGELAAAIARVYGRPLAAQTTGLYRLGDIFACTANLDLARSVLAYEPSMSLEDSVGEFVAWAGTQAEVADDTRAADELAGHGLLGESSAKR